MDIDKMQLGAQEMKSKGKVSINALCRSTGTITMGEGVALDNAGGCAYSYLRQISTGITGYEQRDPSCLSSQQCAMSQMILEWRLRHESHLPAAPKQGQVVGRRPSGVGA